MAPDLSILTPPLSSNLNANIELFQSVNTKQFQQNFEFSQQGIFQLNGCANLDTSVRVYYFDEQKLQLKGKSFF